MKIDAVTFSFAGDKYIGTPYEEMDCQKFVERCMADCGLREDLAGSNAWYRQVMRNGWVGTPEECMQIFGQIPKGALLFILSQDGKEPAKYRGDGIGNANHIGIVIHRHEGAIHSSHRRGGVAYSEFYDKTVRNGGWNRIGLYNKFDYGKSINWILEHGGDHSPDEEKEVVRLHGKVTAPDGSTVNLRKKKDGALLERIPIGTEVTVIDYGAEWCKVIAGGLTGWMMTKFIELDGEVVPGDEEAVDPGDTDIEDDTEIEPGDGTEAMVTIKVPVETCAAAYQFFRQIADQIEKKIGRG